ncbi:MAG: nucleotidyl transferase AbiEii/AbiGii toxin family protein [Candidatus Thermoplasmatota archaeon]
MDWNGVVQQSRKLGLPPIFVLRDEVQKASLASLSRMGAFDNIVLQGGTALRHFYASPRFSEDPDFAVREGRRFDLASRRIGLYNFLSSAFYYLEGKITVKAQKGTDDAQRLAVIIESRALSQRLVINLELFSVPSYCNSPKIMALPPLNPVVRVEDKEELLADKIVAVALRKYLKGRDIWDIYYLAAQLSASAPANLVEKKARDYGAESFKDSVVEGGERLLRNGVGALDREMRRFLPPSAYSQLRDSFDDVVEIAAREIHRFGGDR